MIIPARFNGPPDSGNGGYCAGVFAGGTRCEVTLRTPPPLDTPLSMVDGQVRAPDGQLVAEVAPAGELDTVVPPVSYAEAVRAAAPWTVPDDVSPPTVWAALDCPGGWAVVGAGRPYVLGRIAVLLNRMPEPGDRCVVPGAVAATDGRKALVHTTLYGPDGVELARARATWVAVVN
jgi:hypothetical protein